MVKSNRELSSGDLLTRSGITIGYDLEWPKDFDNRKILVVTDQQVFDLQWGRLVSKLPSHSVFYHVLPAGEASKTLANTEAILQKLFKYDFCRGDILVGFGGGMVGDISGFVASIYFRGLTLIQVPTTLLAMVDAAIGGKTAINYNNEKNSVGSFYPAHKILCDLDFLETLDNKNYIAALAEVIKYGLLGGAPLFDWVATNISKMVAGCDKAFMAALVRRCIEMKLQLIGNDVIESGQRALLNLGHTFAHALEIIGRHKRWLHGEAVAIGLYCQAMLANALGTLNDDEVHRIYQVLNDAQLNPFLPPDIDFTSMIRLMYRDKKIRQSKLRLIVSHGLGRAEILEISDHSMVQQAMTKAMKAPS